MIRTIVFILTIAPLLAFSQSAKPDKLKTVAKEIEVRNRINSTNELIQKNIYDLNNEYPAIHFFRPVNYNTDVFGCVANFRRCTCDSLCNMSNSKFFKLVNFALSNFHDDVRFERDTCATIVKFDNSVFNGTASFIFSQFDQDVYFNNCHFSNYLDLSNLTIRKHSTIHFDSATLPDTIDFSNNRLIDTIIDFTRCSLDATSVPANPYKQFKKYYINLAGTQISKIRIDYVHFRLYFFPVTPGIQEEAVNEVKEATYQQLLKNFQDHGQVTSYKNLDIEYHFFLFDRLNLHWLGWFFYHWWQFGYAKERIFSWIFWFLLVFTGINYIFLNTLNFRVYNVKHIPLVKKVHFSQFMKQPTFFKKIWGILTLLFMVVWLVVERLWYSFAYTCTVFFSLTLKLEDLKFGNWGGVIYLMLIYTSGLLSIAYLAGYVLNK